MYKYLNLHPEGKLVEDCVKRAIAKAFDRDYKEVSLELNRFKKVSGSKEFNDKDNWVMYLESKNAVKMSFPAVKGQPRMNGYRFTKQYPKGSYVLSMAGHLVACVDGVVYDTWNCMEKCVYTAYKIPDIKQEISSSERLF